MTQETEQDQEQVVLGIGYGSNMADPAELDDPEAGVPVKVHGYKRHVQLPASYRRPPEEMREDADASEPPVDLDEYRGVFNVEESEGDEINAVLYRMSPEEAADIEDREAQYKGGELSPDDIEIYGDNPGAQKMLEEADAVKFVFTEEQVDSQKPNPQYLAEVLAGAKVWDQRMKEKGIEEEGRNDFLDDLLQTSEVSGQPLQEYLEDEDRRQDVMRYIEEPADHEGEWNWEEFKTYEGSVESVRDFFTGWRKDRRTIHLDDDEEAEGRDDMWNPVTDEELVFEAKYMTPETRETLLEAVREEHDDADYQEIFHRMRQAARESRERREDAEEAARERRETYETVANIVAGIRYMTEEQREEFLNEIAPHEDADKEEFWDVVNDAWDRYVTRKQEEQEAAADDD